MPDSKVKKIVFSITAFEDGELRLGGDLGNKGACLFIVAECIKAILAYKSQKIVKASTIPDISGKGGNNETIL